jgi:hypothetical protein
MSIKTRRAFFYSLVALFLIAGTVVILHSRGVRFDIKSLEFVKTGGIYISSHPVATSIFLDGESVENKSGLFQRGTLLTNLMPGDHEVKITETGYLDWHKKVEVLPGEVSVLDTVVLPTGQSPLAIQLGQFQNFDLVADHLILEQDGGVTLDGSWVFGHKIVGLADSGSLLTKSDETGNYYLTNGFDPEDGINLSLKFNDLKETRLGLPGFVQLKELSFLPNSDKRFYAVTQNALYLLDIGRESLDLITTDYENFNYQTDGTLVWNTADAIYSFSPVFRNQVELSNTNEFIGVNPKFKKLTKVNGGWLLLSGTGELNYLSRDSKLITDSAADFWVAPNNNRVAVMKNDGVLFAYNLTTQESFLDIGQGADQLIWYKDAAHVLVLNGGGIYFRDISVGEPVNSYQLAEGVQKFKYDAVTEKIYFSKDSGIWEVQI